MMRLVGILVAASVCGCITPRSMTLGQLAAPVGRGATEVGLFGGVMYASQTNPTFNSTNAGGEAVANTTVGRGFSAPMAEANVEHGFDDHFAFNVHASSAGVQPGLKWTINKSRIAHVALLPAVGLGYASYGQTNYSSGQDGVLTQNSPTSVTSFTFLGGLKVLFSHRSGFYAGVGYDFLFNRSLNSLERGTTTTGDRAETLTVTTVHQVSASVGFDIKLGMVRLRPEVAFAVYPGLATTITNRVGATASDPIAGRGGFGFAIFPGFSIAVVSPQRELTEEEAEEEKARVRKRRKSDPDTDDAEDDEDVEEEAPRARPKRTRDAEEFDEDEAPKKSRSRSVEDEDLRD